MATRKQIEANRLNAQRSTGPRTPQGKARVATNAVKHGLTAEKFVLLDEDPEEFEQMRQALFALYDPQDVVEASLVERMAVEDWRSRRIPVLEAALFVRPAHEQALADAQDRLAGLGGAADRRLFGSLVKDGELSDEARAILEAARAEVTAAREQLQSVAMRHIEVLEKSGPTVNLLVRYEGERTRAYYKAMHELERLQRRRAGQDVAPPAALDVTVTMDHVPEGEDAA